MTKLKNYLYDGANYRARATLMFLQLYSEIEDSWNDKSKRYEGELEVGRWENCREQGYAVYLTAKNGKQLNIAFFEHKNSDNICAVKWQQNSINTLTIDNAKFGDVYKDKYDTSHSVSYGKAYEMAEWIINELKKHWIKAQS